jgi:NAD(P)-dependent dehydrogenase (short-subunit alcohol dehydrogenase family)
MTEDKARIALVTGGNRGLGRETVRQLLARGMKVVLTARDEEDAAREAATLGADHLRLDVTDPESIARASRALGERHDHLDVLVNNAGVALDGFDAEMARRTLDVNVRGPRAVTEAFRPHLAEGASIVMVSSGMGELSCVSAALSRELEDPALTVERLEELMDEFVGSVADGTFSAKGWPRSAYRVSKVCLNALTRILARQPESSSMMINAVCPGWVRTDMGGSAASRDVAEGAASIVWAATLRPGGPSGGFFRDGRQIAF